MTTEFDAPRFFRSNLNGNMAGAGTAIKQKEYVVQIIGQEEVRFSGLNQVAINKLLFI